MRITLLCFVVLCLPFTLCADEPADLYRQMLSYRVTEAFMVRDLTLTREAATFEFQSGEVQIVERLRDRHHAILFTGKGLFRLKPPDAIERDQLHKFTGTRVLEEAFDAALLRFSDSTANEILQARTNATAPVVPRSCEKCSEVRTKTLKRYLRNFDSRILRDLYSGRHGYFMAYIFGKTNGEFLLEIDPEQREQMSVVQNSRLNMVDVWSSFSITDQPPQEELSVPFFEVAIEIEKDGRITAEATLEVHPHTDLSTIALNFSPLLELHEIRDSNGNSCFFQYETAEDRIGEPPLKQDRLDVFFATPLKASEKTHLRFVYSSKHLITREGNRNEYFIRDTVGWYPTFGYLKRSSSKVTYCHPKDLELYAVGKKTTEFDKDNKSCSVWEQEKPVAVISFSLGNFKHKKITVPGLPVADIFSGKYHSGFRIGGSGHENVAADVVNSLNFFQTLYGDYPFESILATEIPADHGQGFPGFLHLSRQTFEDVKLKGLDEAFRAHEVSHQWWGHVVGWETYRDQWISEGFAEFSGALYADAAHQEGGILMRIVEGWKDDVLNRGTLRRQRYGAGKMSSQFTMGTEAGPIWLGIRLSSSKSPADYRILAYEKGAYVLHMLRMMMKDFETNSDERFFAMMQDFVRAHSWKNASTESFQSIAEKHYGGSLKWFFDQWVYGTYVPKYEFQWRIEPAPEEDKYILVAEVKQKQVPDGFRMPIPLYMDFGKKRFAVHRILVDEPVETIRVPLPEKPQDVQFNYQRAVLARD